MRYISGKPSFLQNPNFPHKGITTHAHCTAPRRMNGKDFEPVEIHTHYESDYGAAPKVNMRKGQIITVVAPSFTSEKWIGYRAKIIDHPFYDICRSQLDIEIDGDWKKLIEDKQGGFPHNDLLRRLSPRSRLRYRQGRYKIPEPFNDLNRLSGLVTFTKSAHKKAPKAYIKEAP